MKLVAKPAPRGKCDYCKRVRERVRIVGGPTVCKKECYAKVVLGSPSAKTFSK